MHAERVVLIGLSGTGKSAVAPIVAERLGFAVVDLDAEIERRMGRPIPEIFADLGEPVFRAVEHEVVAEACARANLVIATGGGAVLREDNWEAMRPASVIVHLNGATPELLARLERAAGADPVSARPLLAGDPSARIERLRQERAPLYARADAEVDTDGRTPQEVADAIVSAVADRSSRGMLPLASLLVATGRSDLYVAPGLLEHLGELTARRWPEARRAWVVTDEHVGPLWATHAEEALKGARVVPHTIAVPAGEASKSMSQVSALLDRLLTDRIDRRDIVVALGGGVVGDLAGFVAAIVLRGVGLVQVPTSLLAMVDSSVGGKTGVNHALGKNLIGAFYQPQLVVADTEVLATLDERELRAGWAEIVKHAMIERSASGSDAPELLGSIESLPDPLRLSPEALSDVVRRNVLLKAGVVAADERESGSRRLLNYGHTLGHAMEASGYRYLHGEAVALGMRAAATLSCRLGMCEAGLVDRQGRLLDRLGLPARFDGELGAVAEHLTRDKKAVHGILTWILPTAPGCVEERRDVPLDLVLDVARGLGAS